MNRKMYLCVAAALAIVVVAGTAAKAGSGLEASSVRIDANATTFDLGLRESTCEDFDSTTIPELVQPSDTVSASCPRDQHGFGPASSTATGFMSLVVVGSRETLTARASGNGSASFDPNHVFGGTSHANAIGRIEITFILDQPTNVSINISHSLNGDSGFVVSLERDGQNIGQICPTCVPPANTLPTSGVFQPGAYQLRGFVDGESFQGTGQGSEDRPTFSFSLEIKISIGESATVHWIDPLGGSYDDANNWNPPQVPVGIAGVGGDTAIFDLAPTQSVDLLVSTSGGATAGRWIIGVPIQLTSPAQVFGGSPPDPSLSVLCGGSLLLNGDAVFESRNGANVGSACGAQRSRVTVDGGNGARWLNTGGDITLRDESVEGATLTIEDGGVVAAAGGLFAGGVANTKGRVEVRGVDLGIPSKLSVANVMFIGRPAGTGSMMIEDGGLVETGTIGIGSPAVHGGEKITIAGRNGTNGPRSTLSCQGLSIAGDPGTQLEVKDGGQLFTAAIATRVGLSSGDTGRILVNNTASGLPPYDRATQTGGAAWISGGDISLDGLNGLAELVVEDGGVVFSFGDLFLGQEVGTVGSVIVSSGGANLTVEELVVGGNGLGCLDILGGGVVVSGPAHVGRGTPTANSSSVVFIRGITSPAEWRVSGDLNVGVGGHGSIFLEALPFIGGATLSVSGNLTVGPRGLISGNGTLAVPIQRRVTMFGGRISPGLSPGQITIEGDYEQQLGSVLEIEYTGLNPGEFDVLHVTGQAALDGRLEVHFRGGFSPDDPAAFIQSQDFIEADGDIVGDYAERIYAFPDLFADFDDDGDKDLEDVADFQNCFGLSGKAFLPECDRADWEDNGVINEVEIRELSARLSGPQE